MKKIWTEEKLNRLDNEELADFLEEQIDELFEDILDTREDSFDRQGVIDWILAHI